MGKNKRKRSKQPKQQHPINDSNNTHHEITNKDHHHKKQKTNQPHPSNSSTKSTSTTKTWHPSQGNYNDHFETPLTAYQDLLPLLDLVAPHQNHTRKNNENKEQAARKEHTLYDPYYCQGCAKTHLTSLGFPPENVHHRARDFYQDVKEEKVPQYDTLITNPPYSDDHKERCLEFAIQGLRQREEKKSNEQERNEKKDGTNKGGKDVRKAKPFFLLMPAYVAAKEYYRRMIAPPRAHGYDANKTNKQSNNSGNHQHPQDVVYLVPSHAYAYDHPEGTGHNKPPFFSIWFCGIGAHLVPQAKRLYTKNNSTNVKDNKPRVATSLEELVNMGVVSMERRGNPRQRRKRKQQWLEKQQQQKQQKQQQQHENKHENCMGGVGGQMGGAGKASGTGNSRVHSHYQAYLERKEKAKER